MQRILYSYCLTSSMNHFNASLCLEKWIHVMSHDGYFCNHCSKYPMYICGRNSATKSSSVITGLWIISYINLYIFYRELLVTTRPWQMFIVWHNDTTAVTVSVLTSCPEKRRCTDNTNKVEAVQTDTWGSCLTVCAPPHIQTEVF